MKYISFLIQFTYGLVQSLLGLILFLKYKNCKHQFYQSSILTYWPKKGGISLGVFIFVNEKSKNRDYLIKHEYGHSIQSLILGPLYLLIVGLPSFVWANSNYFVNKRKRNNIDYYSFITEKNANYLGKNI